MIAREVMLEIERNSVVGFGFLRRFRLWFFFLYFWNNIYNDWNIVFFFVRLVPPLSSVRIMKVMVVKFWVIVEIIVSVVVPWASEIIIDVKSFPFVSEPKVVEMIIMLLRSHVLGWRCALEASPLDGWFNRVRVRLLFWVVDSDIVWLEFCGLASAEISIIPEVRVIVYGHTMNANSEVPCGVARAAMLVELSIVSGAPSLASFIIEVSENAVEVSLERASLLDWRGPFTIANLFV